ncbi:transient receptor potential cation channel subfamily A member 1-like isoform X2 [Xenia sp. Carnegie-2017]|nr:transient receptor potential cation channel subfamily A member 1-like isoform X2 [Xenia sp. Carnegie-2017]
MRSDVSNPPTEMRNLNEKMPFFMIPCSNSNSPPSLNSLIGAVRRGILMTERYLGKAKNEDLSITDIDDFGRNIFHLSVQREELLKILLKHFEEHEQLMEALHSEDINGHTPAHVAVLHNKRESLQILASADENIYTLRSSKKGQTLIHCAVYSCNPYIVEDILSARPESLFDKDDGGKSPQHYAAALEECFLLDFLLSQGANILETDNNMSTLLHEAAYAGSISNVKLLSFDEVTLLLATDSGERTPLHVACAKGFRSIVSFLLENGADPLLRTTGGESCLEIAVIHKQEHIVNELLLSADWKNLVCDWKNGAKKCFAYLIEKMPDQAKLLLDRCVATSDHKQNSHDYNISYDFFLFHSPGSNPPAFHALQAILKNNEEKCLTHKLCRKYLSVKWREKGCYIFLIDLILFVCFHILFNAYVALVRGGIAKKMLQNHENGTISEKYPEPVANPKDTGPLIATSIIFTLTIFNVLKEFVQMCSFGWNYFKQPSNYFEWTLFLFVLYFIFPITASKTENQFGAAAIAICISWFDLIWFLRRIPDIGTYILTIQKTMKTLLKMLLIILLFCMAYASTFYLLLAERERFKNFPIAILSTFVSMLGDFGYDDLFLNIGYYKTFHSFKLFMFVIFILLMVIVINNVLIGLAVGDTQDVIKKATVQRLRQHMKFMMAVEYSLFTRLPCFRRRKHAIVYTEYPNHKKSFTDNLNRFFAGEMNTFYNDEESDDEVERDTLTRQQLEEVLKVRFEEHHKKIMKEISDFHSEVLEKVVEVVNDRKNA